MAPSAKRRESSSVAAATTTANDAATTLVTQPPSSNVYAAGRGPPLLIKGSNVPDGKTAVRLVQDHALYHNKQVRVSCRGGKHRKIVCTSDSCPFYVQFYQRNSKNGDRSWYLSSFDTSHSATCSSSAKPTRRQLIEMVSFKEAVVTTPGASASSLATYIGTQSHVPLRMNLRTVYRAKEAIRNTLHDRQADSFRRIPSLLSQFLSVNTTSYATHDVDDDGCFVRAFISCGIFCEATVHNEQIFGFECLPVEGTFPGYHLYLLGKDGNRKTLVIAGAVISVESQGDLLGFDHFSWFFRSAHAAGVDIQSYPILCASNTALPEVEAELGLKFRLCTRNLIETELGSMPTFSTHHHALVWGLQASETIHEYSNRLQWIASTCGGDVAAHLSHLPVERWATVGGSDDPQARLYGWRSRDFTDGTNRNEQFHVLAKRLKAKLPIDFLDGLMESWVQAVYERSSSYESWIQLGLRVTPGAQELYDREVQRISDFMVTRSSSSIAFVSPVQSDPTPSVANAGRCRVDLSASTCSCAFMQQHGVPCRHLIAVVLFCSQMDTIYSRFAPCYSVSSYGAQYHNRVVELPLQDSLTESDDCLPPRIPVRPVRGSTTVALPNQATDAATSDLPSPFDELLAPSTEPLERDGPASSAGRKARKRPRPANDGDASAPPPASVSGPGTVATEPQPQPRTVRCSKCKRSGHNARSCSASSP